VISYFSLYNFRFHLEPNAPLHMPAYNKGPTLRLTPKGNVTRGGFEWTQKRARVRDRDCERKITTERLGEVEKTTMRRKGI